MSDYQHPALFIAMSYVRQIERLIDRTMAWSCTPQKRYCRDDSLWVMCVNVLSDIRHNPLDPQTESINQILAFTEGNRRDTDEPFFKPNRAQEMLKLLESPIWEQAVKLDERLKIIEIIKREFIFNYELCKSDPTKFERDFY